MPIRILLATLLATLATSSPAWAIAPRYVPDWELADRPVVVLAHWARAPMKAHSRVSGDQLLDHEIRSRLVVDRVLKGDVKTGDQPLLLGFGFAWNEKGQEFRTYTSTEVSAEVVDVSRPALWFLSHGKSWDKRDKTQYLNLDTYRGVQNATLEPYFRVLMGPNREDTVGDLLKHSDPEVVSHALRFIHAGRPPWPFADRWTDYLNPRDPKVQPLVQHSERIAALLPDLNPAIRPEAAAVYASLAGENSVPVMRGLLDDGDSAVRAVAVGTLARQRDLPSTAAFPKAIAGLKNTTLALEVIRRLESWGHEDLVPALIGFLDNDNSDGYVGDDLLIPSVKAGAALAKITGYRFPLRTRESLEAWLTAAAAANLDAKRRILVSRLGDGKLPLTARLENRRGYEIVLTNVSTRLQVIPGATGTTGGWRGHLDIWLNPQGLRLLKPGESHRLSISPARDFLLTAPKERTVHLLSHQKGLQDGERTWLGVLPVTFGDGWREPPRVWRRVVKRWSNGRVQSEGYTLNGTPRGVWSYYQADGQKTREEDFTGGSTSTFVVRPTRKPHFRK